MKKIALMFSGGLDSTASALKLASLYDEIHLLSFTTTYGHYRIKSTKKRFKELEKSHPKKYKHNIHDIRHIFEDISISSLSKDYSRFRSGFIWCLGCKLSMHVATIAYCIKNNIKEVADGSSGSTSEMVEQMPFTISLFKTLYSGYNIRFKTPVYKMNRDDERELLRHNNIWTGITFLDRQLGIQPKCIPGQFYYLPFMLFGKKPNHCKKSVNQYINDKMPLVKKLIKEELKYGML